jgi:ketosteroid isomerase-like protein
MALQDLATRYARAIDRRDRTPLLSLYHEDAIDSHGTMFEGRPVAFADWQPVVMAPFEVTAHHLTTMNFHVQGDSAEGELYFIAYHRTLPPDSTEVVVTGRYLDRYERRNGTWKIARRSSSGTASAALLSPRQWRGSFPNWGSLGAVPTTCPIASFQSCRNRADGEGCHRSVCRAVEATRK